MHIDNSLKQEKGIKRMQFLITCTQQSIAKPTLDVHFNHIQ